LRVGQPGCPKTCRRSACLGVKAVRELDAGNLHVQFDERGVETEPWIGLRHRQDGESRRQRQLPNPVAAAPRLDSTEPIFHVLKLGEIVGAGCVRIQAIARLGV